MSVMLIFEEDVPPTFIVFEWTLRTVSLLTKFNEFYCTRLRMSIKEETLADEISEQAEGKMKAVKTNREKVKLSIIKI